MVPALTIIVPVGASEQTRPGLLDQLAVSNKNWQVLVAAGSQPEWRIPDHCRLLTGKPGRGKQQNHAAAEATGDWLWFLHADCELAANAAHQVSTFIERVDDALGYCQLRFLNDGPRLTALNAMGANIRSRWFRLPYGDQGLCMPKAWFEKLGGFHENLVRGEDLDLVVRARLAGLPIRPIGTTIRTSARRYRDDGWLKTTWEHQLSAWRLSRDARDQAAGT